MTTTAKSLIMKEAHRIAKNELKGDYLARLSLALKKAWKNFKSKFQKEEKEMLNYKGIEIACTAEMQDIPEPFDRKNVYITTSDDREEKIRIYGVSDKAIAKANNRVFVDFAPQASRAYFDGDTYNHKEEIKELAKKHGVRAQFKGRWEIEFKPESEKEALSILKDLQEYDMNRKTVYDINEIIKSLKEEM